MPNLLSAVTDSIIKLSFFQNWCLVFFPQCFDRQFSNLRKVFQTKFMEVFHCIEFIKGKKCQKFALVLSFLGFQIHWSTDFFLKYHIFGSQTFENKRLIKNVSRSMIYNFYTPILTKKGFPMIFHSRKKHGFLASSSPESEAGKLVKIFIIYAVSFCRF